MNWFHLLSVPPLQQYSFHRTQPSVRPSAERFISSTRSVSAEHTPAGRWNPVPLTLRVSSVIHLLVSNLSPLKLPRSSPGLLVSMSVSPAKTAPLSSAPGPSSAGPEPSAGQPLGRVPDLKP